MLIIGEKINAAIKPVRAAVMERDVKLLQNLAESQRDSGAGYLDINVSTERGTQFDIESMEWVVEKVHEVVDTPLSIDSPDPHVLEAGLRKCQVKSMLNSVTAEDKKLESLLPLAKEFDSEIVALAMGEEGIPPNVEGRLESCEKIAVSAQKYGIALERIYFDPLALSIASDISQGLVTLETLREIKAHFPEAKTTLAVSNISFGLPVRSFVNRSFLLMAMYAGLDSAILDPLDVKLMSATKVGEMVLGRDSYCMSYLQAYRQGLLKL